MLRPLLASFVLCVSALVTAPAAQAAPPTPHAPRKLPAAIEPLGGYVGQETCQPVARRGTVKLARLLASTYRNYGATAWSSTYACGTDGSRSEHYDGRAIDWMVNVGNKKQHTAAKAVIDWLLAKDRAGHRFAMARRLGVMYLIYNNRMWGAWDGRWEEYNNCSHLPQRGYDNACHRTHMHISLTWNGAMGRTSFWTGRVATTDYGPCRSRDLNWAHIYRKRNTTPCTSYPLVHAKKSASATKKALVQYSGAGVRRGWQGPAVSAVQRALHVSATGVFDDATVRAVRHFQRSQGSLGITGVMTPRTWRALLAATR